MKKGFTLAEVLITLSIVGVVSILTLPNLVDGYKKKVYVGQLQRAYNIVVNAINMYATDKDIGSLYDSDLDTYNGVSNFMSTYIKSTKHCNSGNMGDCLAGQYKKGYNTNTKQSMSTIFRTADTQCDVLTTGAVVCISPNEKGNNFTSHMRVQIDVNGKGAPNAVGRDVFFMTVDQDENYLSVGEVCNTSYGVNCFEKVRDHDWKMDY